MLFYLQTKLSIKLQSFPPLMGPGKNIIESISDIKYVSARLQQDKKHCTFGSRLTFVFGHLNLLGAG